MLLQGEDAKFEDETWTGNLKPPPSYKWNYGYHGEMLSSNHRFSGYMLVFWGVLGCPAGTDRFTIRSS